MWRGSTTAGSAARALRSRLLADPIHHPSTAILPIASARTASSPPFAACPTLIISEEAAASVAVSSGARSASDVVRQYGWCYWELSKARLRYRMLSFADLTGGLTSEWFSFEASLLTTGVAIGALSFVLHLTQKSATRMFHGITTSIRLVRLPGFSVVLKKELD